MRIRYSKHAEEQLKERHLSKRMVSNVLLKPQQILPGKKLRKIAQSIVKLEGLDFLIRVIYEEKGKDLEVLTVYKTTKIEKYWRS